MSKIVNTKLKLYFKDADSAQRTISVDMPKASYTDDEINTAMDSIIKSNVLLTKKGALTTKSNAELEVIEKSPYTINK